MKSLMVIPPSPVPDKEIKVRIPDDLWQDWISNLPEPLRRTMSNNQMAVALMQYGSERARDVFGLSLDGSNGQSKVPLSVKED